MGYYGGNLFSTGLILTIRGVKLMQMINYAIIPFIVAFFTIYVVGGDIVNDITDRKYTRTSRYEAIERMRRGY